MEKIIITGRYTKTNNMAKIIITGRYTKTNDPWFEYANNKKEFNSVLDRSILISRCTDSLES